MKRTLIAFGIAILTSTAVAASPYEVIPTASSYQSSNAEYIYVATVFDNLKGKMFICSVGAIKSANLIYGCADASKYRLSAIPPSADIQTSVQLSTSQAKLLGGGFWQMNSISGDLQFCLAPEPTYSNPIPCVMIDWKTAKPLGEGGTLSPSLLIKKRYHRSTAVALRCVNDGNAAGLACAWRCRVHGTSDEEPAPLRREFC